MRIYLYRIFKIAFGGFWTVIGLIIPSVALFTQAIWHENASIGYVAWGTIVIIAFFLLFRVIFLAPYKIWQEETERLATLESSINDPVKADLQRLHHAAANLLYSAKKIHHQWAISDMGRRAALNRSYHRKHEIVSGLSDRILHIEAIYSVTQDVLNKCYIVVFEASQGLPSYHALKNAEAATKELFNKISL